MPQTRDLPKPAPAPTYEQNEAGQEAVAAAKSARQAELEARQGVGQTLGDQFFRGVFDAVLSPGALLGVAAESAGSALGIEAMRDFGRDLGKASSGAAAADLISELSGNRAGAVRQDLAEQQEARPLLSTVARGSGMVGVGVASGLGLAPAPGLATTVAAGAIEGAGAGAQSAYETNESLRDVVASAALGGMFGAAVPLGFAGVAKGYGAAKRAVANAELGATLKEAMGNFAQERVFKAMGARGTDFRKLGRSAPAAEREMRQVADDVLSHQLDDGTAVFQATQSQDELAERVLAAKNQTGEKLGALRREVADFVETEAPQLRPRPGDIATRIETEVIAPLQRSKLTANDAARVQIVADELRAMGDTIPLEQLGAYRKILKEKVYPRSPGPGLPPQVPETALELQKAERFIEEALTKSTDDAAALMGGEKSGLYQALKRQYRSFKQAADITGKAELQDLGNRVLSPSDMIVGAATLGGDIASGGALSALKAAGAAGLHKFVREHSSSVMAVLANRLSRTAKPAVSVAAVGGREAQEAIQNFAQVRNFMRETGEAVGDNPNVRRVAESEAKEAAIERMQELAGDFNPAQWAERNPTPMQKVLFRRQILDTASKDMAEAAQLAGSMRPSLPDSLDVARLGKLMKDADRPAAIGALQNKLRELADAVPPLVARPVAPDEFARAVDITGQIVESAEGEVGQSALRGYVNSSAAINHYMRDAARTGIRDEAAEGAIAALRGEMQAVREAGGSVSGATMRGEQIVDDAQWERLLEPGGVVDYPSFVSTTANRGEAEEFARGGRRAILTFYDSNGVPLGGLGDGASREILLDPGKFRVVSSQANGGTIRATLERVGRSDDAAIAQILRSAVDRLETAEAAEAMEIGHAVRTEIARARKIDQSLGLRTPTDATGYEAAIHENAFSERVDAQLRELLGGEHFGEAGALYRAATTASDAHEKLADAVTLREALRMADQRGPLPEALRTANEQVLAAAEARARLTGEKVPAGFEKELRRSEELFAAGEEAATLDGQRISRIFEHLDDAPKGPDPERAVWDAVAPEIDRLVPVIKQAAGESKRGRYRPGLVGAGTRETERQFQLPAEQRIEYEQRLDKVASALEDPKQVEETGVPAPVAPVMTQKLAQFMEDVPRPRQDIRGKAFETMSSNDLRLASAMYEATVKPLSVLADFRSGMLDYDKVQYAWRQWPGLQVAVQAGILDVLQQELDDDERAGLSDQMLTQLDYLAGFGGRLQSNLDPAFSARIDSLNQPPDQAKPPSGGGALSTPKAEPTFTERVAGAQT